MFASIGVFSSKICAFGLVGVASDLTSYLCFELAMTATLIGSFPFLVFQRSMHLFLSSQFEKGNIIIDIERKLDRKQPVLVEGRIAKYFFLPRDYSLVVNLL